ncbi:SIR2 family protein [Shewanella gelidimarina]|uniref:anti-phage defense-associated sirtuin Dsr1 n=1 Tax=Shewanella gelidimarina TaxID=56813 RepID=UPI00201012DE|nr:anti-phage defense-associated sirtuin Dsr1 [Shewanella gelidimarina]MCL1060340.1 SIR2 family protein [Shewanella gelidimarina]
MQFVTNGPDIPEVLLQSHEEGRVVFFCGAGISYPAGLPGFKGLVDSIYQDLGTSRYPIEEKAYTDEKYDATLDLLERRLPGQRAEMRSALARSLSPKLRKKGATDSHSSLLQLATTRDNDLRLVTTNFDGIFEHVIKKNKLQITSYSAPMLPIPKNSRWNGLVYLHGLLPKKPDENALQRLVLTSGDFGLAYLVERWAARFVSELFRNYVVCFVGYSVNDPVLRYMMDAIAADRMLGETVPQAYAFGGYDVGEELEVAKVWEAKGVTPILYQTPTKYDHSPLHRTLKKWAETYSDGTLGKERIVINHALTRPSDSTKQDDFVGRMLWALCDPSGGPAKCFAEFNPAPSIEWLKALSDDRYSHNDLALFGVLPHNIQNKELKFNILSRPPHYLNSPRMELIYGSSAECLWDKVMQQLARWLVRHLNNPKLILWLSQRGSQLHPHFIWQIERTLDNIEKLENQGNEAALNDIRANASQAIPTKKMRSLWHLFIAGLIRPSARGSDIYRWGENLQNTGLNIPLRLELRNILSPKIVLKEPFYWGSDNTTLEQVIDHELVLSVNHFRNSYSFNNDAWNNALPQLINEFQQLLIDGLDIQIYLGSRDRSEMFLPSISPHRQNSKYYDWVALIELTRDAWLAVREKEPLRANNIAKQWFSLNYLTFKRLALFAASQENCIPPTIWVRWLLKNNAECLWSSTTRREVMRLFTLQGKSLSLKQLSRIEKLILDGPPRSMFNDDLEHEKWLSLKDGMIWIRLAKLRINGMSLGKKAERVFTQISSQQPHLSISKNEREEFLSWHSSSSDPDFEEIDLGFEVAPRKRKELHNWIIIPRQSQEIHNSNWHDVCANRFYHCAFALFDLSEEGTWPTEYWKGALQAWSSDVLVQRSFPFVSVLLQKMPSLILKGIIPSLSRWLEIASKSANADDEKTYSLCHKAFPMLKSLYHEYEDTEHPFESAINHPTGQITQSILNLWFKQSPNDEDKLPQDIKLLLTDLCRPETKSFRHGRVILATRLIALYRVDRVWTEMNILPLLSWKKDLDEAKAIWSGFLWAPRLHQSLFVAFKPSFLDTVYHYDELGECQRQYSSILTFAALDRIDGYSTEDFRKAIEALPQAGLDKVAQILLQTQKGADHNAEEYWKGRILPFWKDYWPKTRTKLSIQISSSLTELSIAAKGEFPHALNVFADWLVPTQDYYMINILNDSGLIERFPMDSLNLLYLIVDLTKLPPRSLKESLDSIKRADSTLGEKTEYKKLSEFFRLNSA